MFLNQYFKAVGDVLISILYGSTECMAILYNNFNKFLQELALSTGNRFALHALAASLLALLASTTSNIPEIESYVENLLMLRKEKARHMLPPIQEDYNPGLDPNTPDDDVRIKPEIIKEALKNAGKDVEQMGPLPRYSFGGNRSPRSSWQEQPTPSSLVR